MFGISGEHILILAVVLLVFGPRRLPELGHTLGKAMKNFKDSLEGVKNADFKHLESDPESAPKPGLTQKHQNPVAEAKTSGETANPS